MVLPSTEEIGARRKSLFTAMGVMLCIAPANCWSIFTLPGTIAIFAMSCTIWRAAGIWLGVM